MIKLGYRNKVKFASNIEDYKKVEELIGIMPIEEVLETHNGSKDIAIFDADDDNVVNNDIIKQLPYRSGVVLMPRLEGVNYEDVNSKMVINGKEILVVKREYKNMPFFKSISDDNNTMIGFELENEGNKLLVINADLKRLSHDQFYDVIKYILEKYMLLITGATSVEEIKDKIEQVRFDEIIASFAKSSTDELDRKIRDTKSKMENCLNKIEEYKQGIINRARDYDNYKLQLVGYESADIKTIKDKIISEFNAMRTNPKILNVRIEGKNIIVFDTPRIFAYDQHGNRYKLNRYTVKMNFENGSVKYYGLDKEYCHQSCWTEKDPHPHVNGSTGSPCLGNIASTMAELVTAKEIYALATIAINYLESVNTDDYAGKNVKYWEAVDEEGNTITNKITKECYKCGYDEEEDLYTCGDCGRVMCSEHYKYVQGRYICDHCIDENGNYQRCEINEEYYHIENMFECEDCDCWYHEEYLHKIDGENYCPDCAEKYEEEDEEEEVPTTTTVYTVAEEQTDNRPICNVCGERINEGQATTCLTCFETIHIGCSVTRDGMTYCNNGNC